jgi:hypothetical protein
MKRAAYYLVAPALCLAVFWNVLFTWFLNDDFAWLRLRQQVHGAGDLLRLLFAPYAQGTVRFLSERLFFLTGTTLFGIHAVPFRVVGLLTWFLCLALAAEIGWKLFESRAAGLLAAIFWTTSYALVMPLAWSSSYNQLLCSLLILAAFYFRLRWLEAGDLRWRIAEWVAYLACFGALEIAVMYPILAAAYTWGVARRTDRAVPALFLPAAAFTAIHFLLIPKNAGDFYTLYFDSRLPRTFFTYLDWAFGPSRFGDLNVRQWDLAGLVATRITLVLLIAYAVWRFAKHDRSPAFGLLWFLAFLAPVLPLVNHKSESYLTLPLAGVAWVAGSALASAWRSNLVVKVLSTLLAVALVSGNSYEATITARWYRNRAERMRALYRAAEKIALQHPGTALLLRGVDNDLFQSGLEDQPFLLVGVTQTYLDSDTGIVARQDLGGLKRFLIPPDEAHHLMAEGQMRVLSASVVPQDVTGSFDFVDVGQPAYADRLGAGWYGIENGSRWMGKQAELILPGPVTQGQRLYITGYGAPSALQSGPVVIKVVVNGVEAGSGTVRIPGMFFSFDFPVPDKAQGAKALLTLQASRTIHAPGDPRELGMIFGTFEIR